MLSVARFVCDRGKCFWYRDRLILAQANQRSLFHPGTILAHPGTHCNSYILLLRWGNPCRNPPHYTSRRTPHSTQQCRQHYSTAVFTTSSTSSSSTHKKPGGARATEENPKKTGPGRRQPNLGAPQMANPWARQHSICLYLLLLLCYGFLTFSLLVFLYNISSVG